MTHAIKEGSLTGFLTPDSGWVENRATLPPPAVVEIMPLLDDCMPEEDHADFLQLLKNIFAQTVETETFWLTSREEPIESRLLVHRGVSLRGSEGKPKLSTILRKETELLWQNCQDLDPSDDGQRFTDFCNGLRLMHPVLRGLLELELQFELIEENGFLDLDADITNLAICKYFSAIRRALEHVVWILEEIPRQGRPEPAMQQMAYGLAAFYARYAGRKPTRISRMIEPSEDELALLVENLCVEEYDKVVGDKQMEDGPFLALCQIMAREVNNALPPELRHEKPCKMDKIVRKAVNEFEPRPAAHARAEKGP